MKLLLQYFIAYISILFSFIRCDCQNEKKKCPFSSDVDKIKYYSKGINIVNIDPETGLDMQFLDCFNLYYLCGYVLDKNDEDYQTSGVHIGNGIDISAIALNELQLSSTIVDKLKPYATLKGDTALDKLKNSSLLLSEEQTNEFNKKVAIYYKRKLVNNYNLKNGTFFESGYFLTPLISLIIKNGMPNKQDDIDQLINQKKTNYLGYAIDNLNKGEKTSRQVIATAISTNAIKCDSHYKVGIIFDKGSDSWDVINQFFVAVIQHSNENKVKDNQMISYSFVAFGEDATGVSAFSNNVTVLNTALRNFKYAKETTYNVDKGIDIVKKYFEVGSSFYKQKIIVLFLTVNEIPNIKKSIDDIQSKGINVIIITKTEYLSHYENILDDTSNILLFDSFESLTKKSSEYSSAILSLICHQAILLELPKEKSTIAINNLQIDSIDSPDYYVMKVPIISGKFKYKVEIELKDKKNSEFNIFASYLNPYPTINNNDVKHMGLLSKNDNPYIIIKPPLRYNQEYFFVSIMSPSLSYNITLSRLEDDDSTVLSNGLFKTAKVENIIEVDSKKVYSFRKCYESLCPFKTDDTDEGLSMKTKISLAKYYAKGLAATNADDDGSQTSPFFNTNLFTCLYKVYTCVYIDEEQGAKIGLPSSNLALKTYTPFALLNEYISKITINKIRPFQVNANSEQMKEILHQQNVEFTNKETLDIYKVTRRSLVGSIIFFVNNTPKCPRIFEEMEENLKFILYMNKFTDGKDFNDTTIMISNSQFDDYLDRLFNKKEAKNSFEYYFQNLLLQAQLNISKEKGLISMIIGKTLFYTEEFFDFFILFIDEICVHENKISLTLYDEKADKLRQLIDFSKKNTQLKEYITQYRTDNPFDLNSLKSGEYNLPIKKIISNEVSHFKTYDKGIKKMIIVIGDEEFEYSSTLKINHNVNASELNTTILEEEQINFLLLTSISPETNFSFYEEKYKSLSLDTIYPVKNFHALENEVGLLSNTIKQTIIRIPSTFNILNDYYENKLVYFEIPIEPYYHTQFIQFNSNKINVYVSFDFPYPNKYRNDMNFILNETDTFTNITIPIDTDKTEFIFVTLEPKEDVKKLKIDLFVCNEEGCTGGSKMTMIYIVVLLVLGIGLFIYGLCSCSIEDKKDRRNYLKFN